MDNKINTEDDVTPLLVNSTRNPASSPGVHLSVTTLVFAFWAAYAFGGITIHLQVRRTDRNGRTPSKAPTDHGTSIQNFIRTENSFVDDDGGPWNTSVADRNVPRPAWLMSFPNSGTTFTSYLILIASNTRRATNYGAEEYLDETGNSVPVFENDLNGPFWADPLQENSTYPTRYVVTKTHCTGYCVSCGPDKYVNTPYSFLHSCLSGHRGHLDTTGTRQKVRVTYSPEKIHRAIHLIRNPFDNIVSRYHLEQHQRMKRDGTEMPSTKEGFRDYCKDVNKELQHDEHVSKVWDTYIFHLLKDVPCHSDFFRYIQWHNLASTVLNEFMQIPTYTLHYENFEHRFNETAKEILGFLELEQVNDFPEFILGKQYQDYFEEDEKVRVKEAFKRMASMETWQNIEHYFVGIEG